MNEEKKLLYCTECGFMIKYITTKNSVELYCPICDDLRNFV